MPTDLENAWDKGFKTGSRSRDAEIERLKAGIGRLRAGIREMKDIFEHCDFVQRGRFMDKCDELLRGE